MEFGKNPPPPIELNPDERMPMSTCQYRRDCTGGHRWMWKLHQLMWKQVETGGDQHWQRKKLAEMEIGREENYVMKTAGGFLTFESDPRWNMEGE